MRQVSVGSQQHRSRLAPLSGTRSIAQWDQDFAFAVVLPLKTRPLMLELHESKGGRRKGRPIARAYIPLAELFPSGRSDCKLLASGSTTDHRACLQPSAHRTSHFMVSDSHLEAYPHSLSMAL